MRLKLVLITSFLSALLGAGASIAIILFLFSSLTTLRTPGPLLLTILLLPIAAVLLGAFFVYRHTARRRKLQALLTALLSTFLTLCLFLAASMLTGRRTIQTPIPSTPTARVNGIQSGYSTKTYLLLHRPECLNHKTNMLVQINAQFFHALSDIIAVYCSSKRLIL